MKLSIVIPVLNEASTISTSLQKVLSHDGDFEVIVVDGGSEDGTPAIVERVAGECENACDSIVPSPLRGEGQADLFLDPEAPPHLSPLPPGERIIPSESHVLDGSERPFDEPPLLSPLPQGESRITSDKCFRDGNRLRLLVSPRGRATQMNLGAEAATGDVLLFLHADTELPVGAMKAIDDSLTREDVVGGRFCVRLDRQGWRYRMISSSINLRDKVFRGFTGDQAMFIRTVTFRSLGGYSDMPLMEDLDLASRMCRAGRVVRLHLHVVTSARRWHKGGVFKTIFLMWRLRLLYQLGYSPAKLKRMYGDTR